MHLMHALERFPEDPHFQLSRIVAWTWGRDSEPIRNVGERVRVTVDGFERRRSPQLEALTALEPLRAVPEVSGEAWIRSGHVYFTVGSFKAALSAFEAGADRAPEPEMKFIAMLGAGRALEALARPDEAMKQYQRALDLIPGAESATVALASLEFMRDERDAALRILDRAFASAQTTTDPGRMTGYGSYIRWPEVKAAMRKALP
jgi:tetratricopeptide (TPR) repeat protein